MSSSEQDSSESSTLGSPLSVRESPYSSPSQQVPHLANAFSGIHCADDLTMHLDVNKPYLRIVEQPQHYFRFRYKSEMVGTHGCLLGRTTNANKCRTHPAVELMNYSGKALIRVRLSQADKDDEHPHKLLEDDQEDHDVSTLVPQQGSYKIGFAGIGIIHTAKKGVPGLLFKKYMERSKNLNVKELRAHCENVAKTINLNIVRLRFSAHDVKTDKEICPPVFSEPIHNMKSAATNDLKICRMSRYFGRPRGGDDVFILVEKVNKKNIIIRFYELDVNGEEVWTAKANFLQSDVHHQYAIVFRTPTYRDPQITKDVKVFIELVRPSDGRTSEPKEFVYKADQVFKQNKRRRVNSNLSSLESSSGGSIKSLSDVPTTVTMINQNEQNQESSNIPVFQLVNRIPVEPEGSPLAEALLSDTVESIHPVMKADVCMGPLTTQLVLDPEPVNISLNSAEFERLINDPQMPEEERQTFYEMDWTEYIQAFSDSITDKSHNSMEFLRSSMQLFADSGRPSKVPKSEPVSPTKSSPSDDRKQNIVKKTKTGSETYTAFYKAEDGIEVKQLVKEICDIIKNKGGYKKQVVRSKLDRLFEIRLNNGDTFLHMALSSNQPTLNYMVHLIHSLRLTYLLNLKNDLQQTILHLAVIHDYPKLVSLFIAKGCDPMVPDIEGNTALHYAVVCGSCLEPLLDAVRDCDVHCDLNATNNEKQTALHLSAVYDSASSCRVLCSGGASHVTRDQAGRAPIHLATYDDCYNAARELIQAIPSSEIDALDGNGNTALQIVCGKQDIDENKKELIKMLLEKKANPMKQEDSNISAWKLVRNKPGMRELFKPYLPSVTIYEDEVKSEPEDEFESADEGESPSLSSLSAYIHEVSVLLDASEGWRLLAGALRQNALMSWFQHTASPTHTLLTHVKELGENISSKSLALILEDLGEKEAASVIRKYIE